MQWEYLRFWNDQMDEKVETWIVAFWKGIVASCDLNSQVRIVKTFLG